MQLNRSTRLFAIVYVLVLIVGCKKDKPLEVLPKADFFFILTNPGRLPAVVKFSSVSTNAETFRWDFDNGTTATLEKPTARYSESKVFVVKLVVSNAAGEDSIKRYVTIGKADRPDRIITLPKSDIEPYSENFLPQ